MIILRHTVTWIIRRERTFCSATEFYAFGI
jgi:hypothetical protein